MDSLIDTGSISLAAFLGVLIVPIVSLLKNKNWSVQVKYTLAIICSFAVAAVTTLVNGATGTTDETFSFTKDWAGFVALLGASATAAQSTYQLWFARLVTNQKLEDMKVL